MRNRGWVLLIALLFVLLTLVYFRHTLFVETDALVTRHLATDLYQYFMSTHENTEWLKQGFMPIGDYWINRGGGFPAVPVEQLLVPSNLLLMAVYALTGSFAVSLRILMPIFYLAILVAAYWYGTIILRRRDASIVLAVAYTFSMYGVGQLEHIDLIGVQPLVLLALIFLEKTLTSPRRSRYMILTSVFLFLVYLTQLYPFYFTIVFMGVRFAFHLTTEPRRLEALKSVTKTGALFSLMAIPFLLPQLLSVPSQGLKDILKGHLIPLSHPPDLFLLRSTADVPIPEVGGPFYLGLSVIVLLLIPIILRKANRVYVFYLLVTLVSLSYAMGHYNPLNIAGWVQEHVPLSFFLRAAGRIMVIGYLSLAVCAAMGFVLLTDKLKPYVPRLLLLLVVVTLIFCDRTVGYEPPTVPLALTQNSAYEYLKEQPGNFRVVEIPSTYLQMATSSMHTNHDVLSGYAWGHGYFDPQHTFADVYNKHLQREVTAQETAFYGVKYIIVNTDPHYYNALHLDLKHYDTPKLQQVQETADWIRGVENYKLVYDEDGYAIYENLLYRGIVFSDEATVQYVRKDPNTLVIDTQSDVTATVIISQSYTKGWIATMEDGRHLYPTEVGSIQRLEVPPGSHSMTLHYQNYESSLFSLLVFYLALVVVAVGWMRRRWFLLAPLIYGSGLIAFSLTLYPWEASPFIYQVAVTCLGTALVLGSSLAYLTQREPGRKL